MKQCSRVLAVTRRYLAPLIFGVLGWSGSAFPASTTGTDADPWEGFNRNVYAFNDVIDTYALRPVAVGYRAVTPDLVEEGISNFFDNIFELRTILNDVLQGKFAQSGEDSLRFLVNTTVGLLGVVDVASRIELEKHQEDFGQTLAVWGIPRGPFLMLPLLGPSTVRDASGDVPDMAFEYEKLPEYYFGHDHLRWQMLAGYVVVKRASLLDAEALLVGDKYSVMRDAYLQRREFLINDGQLTDDLLENDLGEDFFEE
jgi:phospholipid-binding lipoprotein MlaA